MKTLINFVKFASSPTFFALAALLFLHPGHDHGVMTTSMNEHMKMMGMDVAAPVSVFGMYIPAALMTALASMWMMYALMGLFHLAPWLGLFAHKEVNRDASA